MIRNYDEMKNIIMSSGNKFCSATFIKKDGSERVMQIRPASIFGVVKGEAASPAAQKATATRQARHPNLFPVYDVAKKQIRSVNLDTVTVIRSEGVEYTFE